MRTAIDRLIEWRDHGTGPVSYTAGGKEFGDDVIAMLEQRNDILAALKAVRGDDPNLSGNTWDLVNGAIAKMEGR